ncbi:hypothetical protein C8J56DRAFT_25352 [Mycena floridula]|nr:hypothetical protein C8J56DRAFT_25352 [Mycena floridula]
MMPISFPSVFNLTLFALWFLKCRSLILEAPYSVEALSPVDSSLSPGIYKNDFANISWVYFSWDPPSFSLVLVPVEAPSKAAMVAENIPSSSSRAFLNLSSWVVENKQYSLRAVNISGDSILANSSVFAVLGPSVGSTIGGFLTTSAATSTSTTIPSSSAEASPTGSPPFSPSSSIFATASDDFSSDISAPSSSPSPSQSPEGIAHSSSGSRSGRRVGAIVGIVLGILLLLISVGALCYRRRRRQNHLLTPRAFPVETQDRYHYDPSTAGDATSIAGSSEGKSILSIPYDLMRRINPKHTSVEKRPLGLPSSSRVSVPLTNDAEVIERLDAMAARIRELEAERDTLQLASLVPPPDYVSVSGDPEIDEKSRRTAVR